LRRLDEPQILCRGVFDTSRFPEIIDSAREVLAQTVDTLRSSSSTSPVDSIRKEGRKALKRFFSRSINRHPAITVIVIELAAGARPHEPAGA
jgi:mRNA degradation ribonuclease J1/J2